MRHISARLRLIGYWASESEPHWPDPRNFVDATWDEDERFDVVSHLRHGMLVRVFLGPSTCRMCGALIGNEEWTDGEYVWPEGLAHYVMAHDVRLPDAFVEVARQAQDESDAVEIDDGWWRSMA